MPSSAARLTCGTPWSPRAASRRPPDHRSVHRPARGPESVSHAAHRRRSSHLSLASLPAMSSRSSAPALDRLIGLETEYAIRFSPASRRPGNDAVYAAMMEAVGQLVATRPGDTATKRQVFTENGGAFCYEHLPYCSGGGLLEGATPECRSPGQVLLYQQAQEALLQQALPRTQEALRARGLDGELGLLKNCRDAEGHVYGAQENYQADIARGPLLALYRLGLLLLLPVVALQTLVYWLLLVVIIVLLVVGGLVALVASLLLPSWRGSRWFRQLLEGDSRQLEDAVGRLTVWLVYGLTWPITLPFAMLLRAVGFRGVRRQALAFLISRPVLSGSGTVHPDGRFGLSEKGPAIRRLLRLSIHPEDRPLFDTGNLFKPLMGAMDLRLRGVGRLFHRRQRLQLGLSDSNRAQVAELLKVGTTALVLDLVESGALADAPRPRRPLEALRALIADPGLRTQVEMIGRPPMTALEIQRFYLDRTREYLQRLPTPPLEAVEILRLWEENLSALEQRDFGAVVGRLDWVTKRFLLESTVANSTRAAIKTIDLRYHELADGYFDRLEAIGQAPRLVREEDVERALREPPEASPAFLRGRLIRQRADSVERLRVSWDSALIGGRLRGKVIPFRPRPGQGPTPPSGDAAG